MRHALIAAALLACDATESLPEGAGVSQACPRQTDTAYVKTVDDGGFETFWRSSEITCIDVYTDPVSAPNPTTAQKHAAIGRSIDTWNAAADDCGSALCLNDAGTDPPAGSVGHDREGANHNIVTFVQTKPTWRSAFPGQEDAFGITLITSVVGTGQMVDADVYINEAFFTHSVTAEPTPNRADFESVVTHELGHVLGFDHTDIESSMMFRSLGEGMARRSLHPVDVTGLCEVYACY